MVFGKEVKAIREDSMVNNSNKDKNNNDSIQNPDKDLVNLDKEALAMLDKYYLIFIIVNLLYINYFIFKFKKNNMNGNNNNNMMKGGANYNNNNNYK